MGHFTTYGTARPPGSVGGKGFFGVYAQPPKPVGGKTWTQLVTGFESAVDNWYQIFFLNSNWIITATEPGVRIAVYNSLDSVHWAQRVVFNGTTGLQTPGATFGAGVYAVTGNQNGIAPRLFTSPNLVTWTQRVMGFATTTLTFNPVFGNGTFLVVGNGPQYATSPDGITWTQQTAYIPNAWGQPLYDGTQFVAPVINPSNVSKVVTSPDGIHWTESAATLTLANPFFMANRGTSQYVVADAVVNSGNSLNGALTNVGAFNFIQPTGAIAYGSGSDWAQTNSVNGTVGSSADGIDWVQDTVPGITATIDNAAWNGTIWIAVGSQTGGTNLAITRGA